MALGSSLTFPHKCLQSRRQSTWAFPSSETPDPIIKKLFGSRPIPDGFVLADEVVRRIRSSELALAPRAESGWYDYQTWALKALVLPERMPEGRAAQARRGVHDSPRRLVQGSADPDPRDARQAARDADSGSSRAGERSLHRHPPVLSAEPVPVSLAEELSGMEALFLGAHVSVARELGLALDTATGSDTSASEAVDRFAACSASSTRARSLRAIDRSEPADPTGPAALETTGGLLRRNLGTACPGGPPWSRGPFLTAAGRSAKADHVEPRGRCLVGSTAGCDNGTPSARRLHQWTVQDKSG